MHMYMKAWLSFDFSSLLMLQWKPLCIN